MVTFLGLSFVFLLPFFDLCDSTLAIPQCRESFRVFKGNIYGATYANYEVPVDSQQFSLTSFPFICTDFATKQRYGWMNADVYKSGQFLPNYCAPGCIHQVAFTGSITCGIRRPPMVWGPLNPSTVETTNCDDLNLPMHNYSFAQQAVLGVSDGIPDSALKYLASFPWKGIQLYNQFDNETAFSLTIKYLLDNVPTIEELYVIPAIYSFQQDMTNIFNLTTTREWKVISFESVAFPDGLIYQTTSLKALRFYKSKIATIPSWVQKQKNLQYLQIDNDNAVASLTGLELIADLPLEHLFLPRCNLKTLNSPLVTTSSLISLDLSCNPFESLPNDFFKSTPNLLFLQLGGNNLGSLDAELLAPLTQLRTLDIGRQYPYGSFWATGGTMSWLEVVSSTESCRAYGNDANETRIQTFTPDHLPNPEKMMIFEMMLQTKINLTQDYFVPFENLIGLSIGGLNLQSLDGLGIENLTDISILRASLNPLQDENWLSDSIVMNLPKLNVIYVTQSTPLYAPPSMIALAKTQSLASAQFQQDLQVQNNRPMTMNYCDYNLLMNVLLTTPLNESCSSMSTQVLSQANQLITTKYMKQKAYPIIFE
ncbi:unnamed protein product, partial [Mesorhabditis belari]|uniref:Leucine-rich repeat domain-containing protein n=1 Tax=Mesorhabditis belari TaxID=2138241 RepID=A0AAF3EZ61_9BILA